MRVFTSTIACVILLLSSWSGASSLPRFALMTGAKCASCHVNPTGGQMRTDYGLTYSMDALPLRTGKSEGAQESDDSSFTFNPKLSENISIGADYRSQFVYDQASKTSTFHSMTMSLYGSIQLQKKLTFFFKQDLVNPLYAAYSGPEVFMVAKVLPGSWYIKGGDFLPDYGWRLDDHTSYVRGGDIGAYNNSFNHVGLLFLPNYKDVGVEIGGYAGGLFFSGGVFNGSGNNAPFKLSANKAYVGKVEYNGNVPGVNYRIGVSGYTFRNYSMGGVNLGVGTSDFALLGEIDYTHHVLDALNPEGAAAVDPTANAMAAYGELDVRAIQGLWLIGKFDMYDPSRTVADDELKRLTLGLEFFPFPFVEVRPQYRIAMETPSIDNNLGLVQMHVWF